MSDCEEQNILPIMCRLCLIQNVELINLYPRDEFNTTNSSSNQILKIIERCTTVKIHPSDNLSQKICEICLQNVKSILAFQNQCKRNDEELHKMQTKLENVEESKNVDEPESVEEPENVDEPENELENVDESSNVDESENLVEFLDDIETKKILEVNVDALESDDEPANNEQQSKSSPQASAFSTYRSRSHYEKVACHICGKLFRKYNLQFHLNRHNGLRPFKCDAENCVSTFSAPNHLNVHKRECHKRDCHDQTWTCDVCGKVFTRKHVLKVHQRRHVDPNIPCTICHKLFSTPKGLSQHMLVHTQDRKFKCETCRKSFLTNYTLRIHKRVHTQEKPYSCQHCGASFAYNCLLKAHKEKHHSDSTKTESLTSSS